MEKILRQLNYNIEVVYNTYLRQSAEYYVNEIAGAFADMRKNRSYIIYANIARDLQKRLHEVVGKIETSDNKLAEFAALMLTK